MKSLMHKFLALTLLTVFSATALMAQYDDVYYNPDQDTEYYNDSYDDRNNNNNNNNGNYNDDYYDDEYADIDDYDYYYSSRIKRFRRSYSGFGFYDPCYVDAGYYDPYYSGSFFRPATSIYIGFGGVDYFSYRRWNRWNRWNSYRYGFNPVSNYYASNFFCPPGFNSFSYYRPFNSWNSWGYNNYNPYYYNSYTYNSCPSPVSNVYGVNNSYPLNEGINRGNGTTVYGPRTTGTTKTSPRGVVQNPRLAAPYGIDKTPRTVAGSTEDFEKTRATSSVSSTNNGSGGSRTNSTATSVPRTNPTATSRTPRQSSTANSAPRSSDVQSRDRTISSRPVYRPSQRDSYSPPASYKPRTSGSDSQATRPTRSGSTYKPSTRSGQREAQPAYRPSRSNRTYSPSSRSSGSSRSYTPSRSSSPSKSYSPSRSSTPSRSSASPSRSSSNRSSASPSRSSSSPRSSSSSSSSKSPRSGKN